MILNSRKINQKNKIVNNIIFILFFVSDLNFETNNFFFLILYFYGENVGLESEKIVSCGDHLWVDMIMILLLLFYNFNIIPI